MNSKTPHAAIVAALRTFDSYVHGVRTASYFFLEMENFPSVSKDAKIFVSMFLEKPQLDLDYRDENAFRADIIKIGEWLNDFEPKTTNNDARECFRFEQDEFLIALSMWK